MSKPLTPTQLLAALKAEGLTVREYSGWRDRCRCHAGSHERGQRPTGRGWGSVHGTVVHITAGNLGSRSVETYIRDIINGDPNVPTKSQFVVAPDGTVWLNSAGRCNHAGQIGTRARDGILAGDFSTTSSYDDRRGASVDGNSITYGIENIAASKMTDAQREASVRICAAIARAFGWDGRESIGHGEISSARGKADPNLHMGDFRRDVMARVGKAVPGTPAPSVPPKPTVPATPAPKKTSTSVLLVNCASKRDDVGAGSWAKRRPILAAEILASDASFIVCSELYSGQRASLQQSIASEYSLAGYREGRVIFNRTDRWKTPAGSWWRNLRAGRKPSVVDKFTKLDTGAKLTLFGLHLTWETDKLGAARRAAEVRSVIAWARKSHSGHGRRIYAGDVNSPAGSTTRPDDVGPVFKAHGYHDLGLEAGAPVGRGRYHLDRAFGGEGVVGTRVVVKPTDGSDHPVALIQFDF